jgi:hypothetical protein
MFEGTTADHQELSVEFSGPRSTTAMHLAVGPDIFAARSPVGRRDPMSAFELESRGTRLDLGA